MVDLIQTATDLAQSVSQKTKETFSFLIRQNDDGDLAQSMYNFEGLSFPSNLESEEVGHYMVINISVPTRIGGSNQGRGSFTDQFQVLPNEYPKVDVLRFSSAAAGGGGPQAGPAAIPTSTRRIAESIALFMPPQVVYDSVHEFEEVKLANMGLDFVNSFIGGGQPNNLVRNIPGMVKYPINPAVEVIYKNTSTRQFTFDFLFAPKNQAESEALWRIRKTLMFHSSPELDPQTNGATFIPPAVFDITFYNKGNENTKLPRINTCVLSRFTCDFTPNGIYSTFTNGYPVYCHMMMVFNEMEIIHKKRVAENGF